MEAEERPERIEERAEKEEEAETTEEAEKEKGTKKEEEEEEEEKEEETQTSSLSKNAQKKILKLARYEELKPIKRRLEKERRRTRREEAKRAGEAVPSRRSKMPPRGQKAVASSLVIDLGFDALMTDKEIKSMASQLSMSYSCNRRALRPFSILALCGEGPVNPLLLLDQAKVEVVHDDAASRDADLLASEREERTLYTSRLGVRMETTMQASWRRWQDVVKYEQGGLERVYSSPRSRTAKDAEPVVVQRDQVVYLTADAETELERIEEGCAYVIGGLVDRNRHKNVCAQKALQMGLRTARLPIASDRLTSSQVMTVNQVVEILLAFNELGDWTSALDRHLPRRKLRDQKRASEDCGDRAKEALCVDAGRKIK